MHHSANLRFHCLRPAEETLYQKGSDGVQFVDVLRAQGIVPGIKVDTGLQVGRPPAAWQE